MGIPMRLQKPREESSRCENGEFRKPAAKKLGGMIRAGQKSGSKQVSDKEQIENEQKERGSISLIREEYFHLILFIIKLNFSHFNDY